MKELYFPLWQEREEDAEDYLDYLIGMCRVTRTLGGDGCLTASTHRQSL